MPDANQDATKDLDERHLTRGGGTIRVETWVDRKGKVVRYALAYVNHRIFSGDNGRVLGYDNSHLYPGFATRHHRHWMGAVEENLAFVSFDDLLVGFENELAALNQQHGKDY